MNADIAVLKHRADLADKRFDRIDLKLDAMADTLGQIKGEMATKRDLVSWTWQFVLAGAAIIGIVVGGIIGGMGWLQSRASFVPAPAAAVSAPAPAPIVIQMPPAAPIVAPPTKP